MSEFGFIKKVETMLCVDKKREDYDGTAMVKLDIKFTNVNGVVFNALEVHDNDKRHSENKDIPRFIINIFWGDDEEFCGEGDDLETCYFNVMKEIRRIYICLKCQNSSFYPEMYMDDNTLLEKQSYCFSCFMLVDHFHGTGKKVKDKYLFDCFICREEAIDIQYKAKLNCAGESKHQDFICHSCFLKNKEKCPICRT